MIIKEYYLTREDGVKLYRTYDDEHHYIQQEQTGAIYTEAIDVETAPYTYIATEDIIEEPEEPEEPSEPILSSDEALEVILGGE